MGVNNTQNKNRELFETMPVAAAVRTMAVPTVIGQLIVLIYSMADTFFVGRTNNPSMVVAASLVLPVFNVTLSIAGVAGIGGGALVSRLLGEKANEEIKRVYSFCIYFSSCIAVLFSLMVLIFMKPLLAMLGAGADTYEYAYGYAVWVIVVGGLPTILSNVFSNMVRSIGESSKAGFGVTMGGIINIILDPVFMFVILPKGNEIIGAGIATCISNCISCAYFIIVILTDDNAKMLKLISFRDLPKKNSIIKIFAVGVPSSVATLLFDVDYVVLDKLMSGYGDIALASVGIVLKAERLPLNVGIGICQAMIPIVAYNYASANYVRMKAVSDFSMKVGVLFAVFSIILYEIFAPYIMMFFIDESETVALGTDFLRVRCLATVFMFLSFFHVHLFNGYGRGQEALFLGVMRWAVFNIPMLFILNHFFGMYGLVWSQLISDIMTVALSLITHKRYLKKSGLTEKIKNQSFLSA